MRRINSLLTLLILVLFLLHGIFGAFQLFGIGATALKGLARAALTLTVVHALIGVKLTYDSIRVWRKTGAAYFRENRMFWTRRISGLAVLVLLVFHMLAFSATGSGGS